MAPASLNCAPAPLGLAHLHHAEGVAVEGHRPLRAGIAEAQEVGARHLAGVDELALGPVAHDLHAGLAVDDHGGGEVPVAAGEVRVDQAADRAQLVERLDHGRAGQGLLVELDEGLLVELGPAGADHRTVEDGGLLPGLAAMGHRGHAGLLELAASATKFSQVVGSGPPTLSNSALFTQTQLVECMLNGAAT